MEAEDEINKKLLENYISQSNEIKKLQEQIAVFEKIAKTKMSKEAISRYGTLKTAHPDIAVKAIIAIAQAVQAGLDEEIDDKKFKEILTEINNVKK